MDLFSGIPSFIDGLIHFLEVSASDPLSFSVIFFIYTLLAAIILPFPVEIGLFFSPATPVLVKVLIMGLGKMVGAILVYYIGLTVGERIRIWSSQWRFFNWIVNKCEWLVSKFHYVGLYIILSIPIMPDTVPLYLFSMFNEQGVLQMKWFALVSFLGGVTRGLIVFAFFSLLGVKLI
jgi:membrane protein YqaA with SNARE-associated domain